MENKQDMITEQIKDAEEIAAKRIAEEKAKMEEAFNKEILKIKADAQKLRELSEEDRTKYLIKQQEEALIQREAALLKRELENLGEKMLLDKKLPSALIGCVRMESEEKLKESIELLEKEFGKAVDDKVNKRLGGVGPKALINYDTDPFLKGLKN